MIYARPMMLLIRHIKRCDLHLLPVRVCCCHWRSEAELRGMCTVWAAVSYSIIDRPIHCLPLTTATSTGEVHRLRPNHHDHQRHTTWSTVHQHHLEWKFFSLIACFISQKANKTAKKKKMDTMEAKTAATASAKCAKWASSSRAIFGKQSTGERASLMAGVNWQLSTPLIRCAAVAAKVQPLIKMNKKKVRGWLE